MHRWCLGLNTDDMLLSDAYKSMPRNKPYEIDPLVITFENPQSKYAFFGAVTLLHHDCIHILLGRGVLPQDEAFVIGFTMGTAKEDINWKQLECYKQVASVAYHAPYHFSSHDMVAFNIGFGLGLISQCEKVYEVDFESLMDQNLGSIRKMLNIEKHLLVPAYKTEARMIPNSIVSKRIVLEIE